MEKSVIDWIAYIFVVIGALNWGLVAIGSFTGISYAWDIVALIFSSIPWLAAIIYILIALSGIWVLMKMFK